MLDRCIPHKEIARYHSIVRAAPTRIGLSTKMEARKRMIADSTTTETASTTYTEYAATTKVIVRIPEERIREVEVTRLMTKTKTEMVYTASPTPQPSAMLIAAPSPTILPDIDGDGLSGTQDPTETRASTIFPTPPVGSPASTSTSEDESSTGEKKYPVPTTILVSPERQDIINIGQDGTFTRFIPAVYARVETTEDNEVIERYVSPELVARDNETNMLKASMRASGVQSGVVDWRLCVFPVGLAVAMMLVSGF